MLFNCVRKIYMRSYTNRFYAVSAAPSGEIPRLLRTQVLSNETQTNTDTIPSFLTTQAF
jgi:hypothetical protein